MGKNIIHRKGREGEKGEIEREVKRKRRQRKREKESYVEIKATLK